MICRVKVKESLNRPGVAQRVPGGLGSQISRHLAQEGGEVISPMHRPPLPPGMFLVLIFIRGWVNPRAMEWLEGNTSLKNTVTPPGIDPGTVWLVTQRLNHYTTPGPMICRVLYETESMSKQFLCDWYREYKEWGPSHHVTHCSLLLRLLHDTLKLLASVKLDKKKQRTWMEVLMNISETPYKWQSSSS
jgi:hypothetical protein